MGRLTEILDNVWVSGTHGQLSVVGSLALTNTDIDVNVDVNDIVSVVQSGNYITVDTFPGAGGSSKHEGIHMAVSGLSAGTNFSGLVSVDSDRYLKQVVVYGGLADDDVISVAVDSNYVVSGVYTVANSSHSFIMTKPVSVSSGANLIVFVDNNTTKDASVNASVEWIL